MTENRAIELLEREKKCYLADCDGKDCDECELNSHLDTTCEEMADAFDLVIRMLKKNKSVKPKFLKSDWLECGCWVCPECDTIVSAIEPDGYETPCFCRTCGRKFDWYVFTPDEEKGIWKK